MMRKEKILLPFLSVIMMFSERARARMHPWFCFYQIVKGKNKKNLFCGERASTAVCQVFIFFRLIFLLASNKLQGCNIQTIIHVYVSYSYHLRYVFFLRQVKVTKSKKKNNIAVGKKEEKEEEIKLIQHIHCLVVVVVLSPSLSVILLFYCNSSIFFR